MAFLDMPVGRSVFLAGDSGRIEEVLSSVPPRQAQERFTAQERAIQDSRGGSDESQLMAELERQSYQAASEGPPAIADFTIVDTPPGNGSTPALSGETVTAEEASRLIETIVQHLAQLGPAGWQEFSAEFALTVSSQDRPAAVQL